MQQLFIELVLKQEQEVYKAEGLQWVQIEYFDNEAICNMIDAPKVVRSSILQLLTSESRHWLLRYGVFLVVSGNVHYHGRRVFETRGRQ